MRRARHVRSFHGNKTSACPVFVYELVVSKSTLVNSAACMHRSGDNHDSTRSAIQMAILDANARGRSLARPGVCAIAGPTKVGFCWGYSSADRGTSMAFEPHSFKPKCREDT